MEQRKLLLADDSITIQKVINLTFADEGIEVTAFGNGATAIEKLNEVKPDLVLADVHMPGLSGYEVCERIRHTPGFENIPVMLLVGSFEPFDEMEARRVGANDFLTKPFQSIKQLVSKVHFLLENSTTETSDSSLSDVEKSRSESKDFSQTGKMPFAVEDAKPLDYKLPQTSEARYGFGDSMFDDEMIQTSPAGDFAQTLRDFEVSPANQETENEWQVIEQKPEHEEPAIAEDFGENQPALEIEPEIELVDFDVRGQNAPTVELDSNLLNLQIEENQETPHFYYQSGEKEEELLNFNDDVHKSDFEIEAPPYEEQTAFAEEQETPTPEISTFDTDSGFELSDEPEVTLTAQPVSEKPKSPFADLFDDDDLLGIEEEIRAEVAEQGFQPAVESDSPSSEAISPEIVSENENQSQEIATINQQTGMQKSGEYTLNFPPEVIDAIAARVVEKLSDKVIEKIAWEIVPERFDLIVRKTIRDKDRDR